MVDLSIDLEELPELLELYKKKLQDTRVKLCHSEQEVASLRSSQSQPRLRDIANVEPELIDSKLTGDLSKAQDELKRARSRANAAEGELMVVGDKLDQQEQEIANLQAENNRLRLRIEQLQEDSGRAKRDVSQWEEEAGQLRAEIKRVTDENQRLSASNAQQKAVSQRLKSDYDQEHARLLKLQSQLEAQAGAQWTIAVARDEAIRERDEIQHERDELQATAAALEKSVEALRKERDSLAKKLPPDGLLKWMTFEQTMQKMPLIAGVPNVARWRNCIPYSIHMNHVKAQEYLNSAELRALCNHNSILYAGHRLLWFMDVHQHAFLVTSSYHPNSDDKSQWERNDEYDKLVNRTLEVVYTPDGISGYYVGTYKFVEGPKQITLRDLTGYRDVTTHGPLVSDMIEYSKIQNPRGSFATERMIGQLYEDGTATLDVLGLQCVGYNNDLNRALQDKLSNLQAERDMPGRAPSSPVRLHRVTRSSVLEISGRVPPGVGKRPRGDSDAAEVSRRQKASRR